MNQATLHCASIELINSCSELSYDEEQEREHLEKLVERAFYEAGKALRTLCDKKLYRSTHTTFEQYCRDRFGFERRQSYRLIEAAGVIDNIVEMCPNRTQILPTNEWQIRPLTKLDASEQQESRAPSG